MAKNFLTNIIIGGRVNPSLYAAFGALSKYANKVNNLTSKINNTAIASKEKLAGGLSTVCGIAKKAAVITGGVLTGSTILSGKAMIDQAANMEQYRNTLNVVMKDHQKAAETFKWAVDFANKTPFETDEIVQATVKLTSYGVEAKKTLPLIGDMAGVMGKSMDQAVEAIADAQTGELERLKEFGITKQMIVEQGNKKLAGIELVNQKGQITNQRAFNAALFSLMQDRFKGGMELQSKTFKGLMSTVSGIWKNGLARMAGIDSTGTIIKGSMFDVVKEKVSKLGEVMLRLQEDGTFDKIQSKIAELVSNGFDKLEQCLPSIIAFGENILSNAPQIFNSLIDGITNVGDLTKNIIDLGTYLTDNGPSIIDTVKFIGAGFIGWKVITGVADGVGAIQTLSNALGVLKTQYLAVAGAKAVDKMETIYLQILYAKDWITQTVIGLQLLKSKYLELALEKGRNLAIGAYMQAMMLKDSIVMGIKTAATWAMTAAQGAFNIAMSIGTAVASAFGAVLTFLTSPIGLVIVAITAVIGISILLYQNWETVSNFMVGIWQDYVLPFFTGVGAFFTGVFDGICGVFKGVINTIIGGINFVIGAINGINFDVPDWVPLVGGKHFGMTIPEIPAFAKGGFTNTPSIFGEAGLEAAIPIKPKNPRSISLLHQTAKMLGVSDDSSKNNGNTFIFAPNLTGNTKKEVKEQLDLSYQEFKELIERYFDEKDRESF